MKMLSRIVLKCNLIQKANLLLSEHNIVTSFPQVQRIQHDILFLHITNVRSKTAQVEIKPLSLASTEYNTAKVKTIKDELKAVF